MSNSTAYGDRIQILEKQRENDLKSFNQKKEKLKEEYKQSVLSIKDKFQSVVVDHGSQLQTVGLVTVEDYNKNIKTQTAIELEKKRKLEEIEKKKNQPKKPKLKKNQLSFNLDDDEEETQQNEEEQPKKKLKTNRNENDNENEGNLDNDNNSNSNIKKKENYFGKDPTINTEFLPDFLRDEKEREERDRLTREWTEEQEKIKLETIEITYSYWDGSGHRRSLKCTKGTTIEKFLEMVRKEFKELRGVSVDHLIFVKEDLIIPHDYSFYDFILTKARGKSGPLFKFDVQEDIRLVNDATVEKEETHAAKVVEKNWYERNKHIFPASRWTLYDPNIQIDKYTTSDKLYK